MLQCIGSQRMCTVKHTVTVQAVNCEKYCLKSENLGENPKFPVILNIVFHWTTYITLYFTLPTDRNAYASCASVYIFPLQEKI